MKESIEGADLIERGMLFHSLGAATAKARPPLDLGLDWGTARSSPKLDDLRGLVVE